jgi:Skp family chaperone for outer membrane proteins
MDERAEIEAATDRLLDGIPLRSDGKLTIVSLAAEAGVKRHVLTHEHTDLKDRFNARVKAKHAIPASGTALREQNDQLRRKLDDMRAERDEYKRCSRRARPRAQRAHRRKRQAAEPDQSASRGRPHPPGRSAVNS